MRTILSATGILSRRILPFAFVVGLITTPIAAGAQTFENGAIFHELNADATDAATADVDGDGRVDVVVSHASTGTVSLFRGNGDGTLLFVEEDAAGVDCGPMAAGDLNGDGETDVVVTNRGANSLSVMMASFGGLVSGTVGLPGTPVETRLGDLDHDGDLDAIVLLSSPREIGWLRAHGDGNFDPYATLVSIASGTPTQLEVSDLNVDGDLDAVALVGGAVGIGMGTGSGSFGALTFPTYPAAPSGRFQPQPGPMRLRHLANGSTEIWVFAPGLLCVPGGFPCGPDRYFVATWSSSSTPTSFAETQNFYLPIGSGFRFLDVGGNGDGDFVIGSTVYLPVLIVPNWNNNRTFGGTGVAAADLDGDGHPDLVGISCRQLTVALLTPVNEYTVRSGAGASYFDGSVFDASHSSYAFADFDEDGHPDAVGWLPSTNVQIPSEIHFWHGASDGTFSLAAPSTDMPTPLNSMRPADVNGDGQPDLVALGTSSTAFSNEVRVSVNLPGTAFASPVVTTTPENVTAMVTGDLNHDGRADAVVNQGSTGILVLLGNADATFTLGATYGDPGNLNDLEMGDLDRDGNLDVVAANFSADKISIWRGNGDGTLASPIEVDATDPREVAVGDLNGDGWPDLCVQTPQGVISRISSAGVLGAPTVGLPPPAASIRLQDVDLDGRADLLFVEGVGGTAGPCAPFRVALSRGDGTFQFGDPYARGFPRDVAVLPLDPGLTPDLVFSTSEGFSVLRGLNLTTYTITASAGAGGTISPSGIVHLRAGAEPRFLINPSAGHSILDVRVDDVSVGAVASYTFPPISADHTIAASFVRSVALEFDFGIDKLMLGKPNMEKAVPAYLEPAPPDTPADLVASSILLNQVVAIDPAFVPVTSDHDHDGISELEVRFRRADLDLILPAGDSVAVTVTGQITGGVFHGSDVVEIRRPKVQAPHANQTVAMGSQYLVQYEAVPGVEWVSLLHSVDDGATWITDATEVGNDGAIVWQVPNVASSSARVAVAQVEEGSMSDPEPIGVLAVSEPFRIENSPVGVAELPRVLQLAPIAPTPSRASARVSFALPRPAHARVEILDLAGRRLCTLVDEALEAGWHARVWRGEAGLGRAAAGVYVVRLQVEGVEHRRRIVWMR